MKNLLISACLLGCACRYDGGSKPCPEVEALLERYHLVPVCPEQLGGLPTPRPASERKGNRVVNEQGEDVTRQYGRGALEALRIARLLHCETAVLKERSPSCGYGRIYDGTFSGTLVDGDGTTAELLEAYGMEILGESQIGLLLERAK